MSIPRRESARSCRQSQKSIILVLTANQRTDKSDQPCAYLLVGYISTAEYIFTVFTPSFLISRFISSRKQQVSFIMFSTSLLRKSSCRCQDPCGLHVRPALRKVCNSSEGGSRRRLLFHSLTFHVQFISPFMYNILL